MPSVLSSSRKLRWEFLSVARVTKISLFCVGVSSLACLYFSVIRICLVICENFSWRKCATFSFCLVGIIDFHAEFLCKTHANVVLTFLHGKKLWFAYVSPLSVHLDRFWWFVVDRIPFWNELIFAIFWPLRGCHFSSVFLIHALQFCSRGHPVQKNIHHVYCYSLWCCNKYEERNRSFCFQIRESWRVLFSEITKLVRLFCCYLQLKPLCMLLFAAQHFDQAHCKIDLKTNMGGVTKANCNNNQMFRRLTVILLLIVASGEKISLRKTNHFSSSRTGQLPQLHNNRHLTRQCCKHWHFVKQVPPLLHRQRCHSVSQVSSLWFFFSFSDFNRKLPATFQTVVTIKEQ